MINLKNHALTNNSQKQFLRKQAAKEASKLSHEFSLHNLQAFNWRNIANWKRFEETFKSDDEQLVAIVTSESVLRQIHDYNFKVKATNIIKIK